MTREEFIQKLRDALQGSVPEDIIRTNVNYYQNYFTEEMAKGRSEEDVLSGLGDPRLIARTIINAQPSTGAGGPGSRQSGTYQTSEKQPGSTNRAILWKPILILVVVLLLIVILVSSVIGIAFRILFSPVFWIVIIILAGLSYFSRRRR